MGPKEGLVESTVMETFERAFAEDPRPGGLKCTHSNCRHRGGDDRCLLLAAGTEVLLNGIGQCEMREPKLQAPHIATICAQPGCGATEQVRCVSCKMRLCFQHVHWLPNMDALIELDKQEREHPSSVTPDQARQAQTPFCHVCYVRNVGTPPTGYRPFGDEE